MKFQFKVQAYQTAAVESVVDCFAGQPFSDGINYRMDPGKVEKLELSDGFKNADLALTPAQILKNIQEVQKRQLLPQSTALVSTPACTYNLDVEMETGTGKTYCYIKSIFEMNKLYGWTKFIIMVPSIAIREGVKKSFSMTADHFTQFYGKKARFFIYSSKRLHELESFSSDAGINVMIMNIQAFNARGKDNRRIYEELDDFQSRRPIDVISANRPILILDEPQKMEGKATTKALPLFNPLMILRYSATHKTQHNRIHRLDALDAYNQKLVKKIGVRGITVKGLAGTGAYLYLESIEISKHAPVARMDIEVKLKSGQIKRKVMRLSKGDNLFTKSGGLDQYNGYTVSEIDARIDQVEFANGVTVCAGDAFGDVNEDAIRRIQIRETIRAHLGKEAELFDRGVKVLSLFFIDEVKKYRDYSREDTKGEYARIFEEEYAILRDEVLGELDLENSAYRGHLEGVDVGATHKGYFSIDKKSKRLVDPKVGARSSDTDDVDAYDLILKDKERLLSFAEPTRFIFSHSALREGWDNPNVFAICTLKHSDNTILRRQEVGRGLRICVDQDGNRVDDPAIVHDVNVLTVVASESYKDFVSTLQREMSDSLSARPKKADEKYFTGRTIVTETGDVTITPAMAKQIYRYLIKNDYTDDADQITEVYYDAKEEGTIAAFAEDLVPYQAQILEMIDAVYSDAALPDIENGRGIKANPLNDNFDRKEFQELWKRINRKAVYRVEFDTEELAQKCIAALETHLQVTPLQYTVEAGVQTEQMTDEQLKDGAGFSKSESATEFNKVSVHSRVKYDLLGKLSENTQLTRHTIASILQGVQAAVFGQFRQNPEHFIAEASRLMNEQKAAAVIEHLSYDEVAERYDSAIFHAANVKQDFSKATDKLKNHIYDYVVTDSKVERAFVGELDVSAEVVVYAKLPSGFHIPTPVGNYNPDWAIAFKEGSVRHIYFVAETKGSMSTMHLREIEKNKIECARKFFEKINASVSNDKVKYDVVTDYSKLMALVA